VYQGSDLVHHVLSTASAKASPFSAPWRRDDARGAQRAADKCHATHERSACHSRTGRGTAPVAGWSGSLACGCTLRPGMRTSSSSTRSARRRIADRLSGLYRHFDEFHHDRGERLPLLGRWATSIIPCGAQRLKKQKEWVCCGGGGRVQWSSSRSRRCSVSLSDK
jgi:hypothetical protein